MSRLDVLNASLAKKEAGLDRKLRAHFDDVRSANGQPLNDKRNGQATMNRWERQSDGIRNQFAEIEKTKNAIEREERKISDTERAYDAMPEYLRSRIDEGVLVQWRKHPHIMFVAGVDKARIYWDQETNQCSHKYVREISDAAQYAVFRDVFNAINKEQSEARN